MQYFDDLLQQLDVALRGAGGDALARKIRPPLRARADRRVPGHRSGPVPHLPRICTRRTGIAAVPDRRSQAGDLRLPRRRRVRLPRGQAGRERRAHAADQLALDPALVRAVNTLFGNAPTPFVFPGDPVLRAATPPSASRRARRRRRGQRAAAHAVRSPRDRRRDRDERTNKRAGSGHWFYRALAVEIIGLLDGRTLHRRAAACAPATSRCSAGPTVSAPTSARRCARLGVPSVAVRRHERVRHARGAMRRAAAARPGRPGDAPALRVALLTPLLGLDRRTILAAARRRGAVGRVGRALPALERTLATQRLHRRVSPPARRARSARPHASRPGGERCDDQRPAPRRAAAAGGGGRPARPARRWSNGCSACAPTSTLRAERRQRVGADPPRERHARAQADHHPQEQGTAVSGRRSAPFLWDAMLRQPDEARAPRFHDAATATAHHRPRLGRRPPTARRAASGRRWPRSCGCSTSR